MQSFVDVKTEGKRDMHGSDLKPSQNISNGSYSGGGIVLVQRENRGFTSRKSNNDMILSSSLRRSSCGAGGSESGSFSQLYVQQRVPASDHQSQGDEVSLRHADAILFSVWDKWKAKTTVCHHPDGRTSTDTS